MLKKISFVLLVLFLAGCQTDKDKPSAVPASPAAAAAPAASTSGQKVFPDFKVKGFDNREVSLAQYRGKVLILDLFATWCPPCRQEIPHFNELQQAYLGKVAVVGLAYDQGAAKDVLQFAKEMQINYDIYWGSEEIAQFVGLRGIPHTLVIDAQGHVVKSYVGYQDKEVFDKDIQDLLKGIPL
jgi:thiol-disulfide isomerase/thioredoxin